MVAAQAVGSDGWRILARVFEITLGAADGEVAIERVLNAVAAASADDHVRIAERRAERDSGATPGRPYASRKMSSWSSSAAGAGSP